MPRKVVFTVVRNEAPFLLEWIAYHRVIGFDTFVVYSNNCTDETPELLDNLHRHGVVVHERHSPAPGRAPQEDAVRLFTKTAFLRPGDYCAFIDPDEFINVKVGSRRIDDLIAVMKGFQGIVMPWRQFGDSGNLRYPGRFISPDFALCAPPDYEQSRLTKTFFLVGPGFVSLAVHKALFDEHFWRRKNTFLNPRGEPIDLLKSDYAAWSKGEESQRMPAEDVSYDLVQVNHYQYRTAAAFALKAGRGEGSNRVGSQERGSKYAEWRMSRFNVNECVDTSILVHERATTKELRRLCRLDGVGRLQSAAYASFQAFETELLGSHIYAKPAPTEPPRRRGMRIASVILSRFRRLSPARTRFTLHIGQPRTGTTTLQNVLFDNRHVLKKQGVVYPDGLLGDNHLELACAVLPEAELSGHAKARLAAAGLDAAGAVRAFHERLARDIDEVGGGRIVLSSEALSHLSGIEWKRAVLRHVEQFGEVETCVAYVRSPIEGMMSHLLQSLLGGTGVMRNPAWLLNVGGLLQYRDLLGSRLVIRNYEHLLRDDIVADFRHHFLTDVDLRPVERRRVLNSSLSAEAMHLFQKARLSSGVPFNHGALLSRLRRADAAVAGFESASPKEELLPALTSIQEEALKLRDEFGVTFSDVDYSLIGKALSIELDAMGYVENICAVDRQRSRQLSEWMLEHGDIDAKLRDILARMDL